MSRSEALSDEAIIGAIIATTLLTALDGLVECAASGMLDEALLRRVVIATVGIFARSSC